MIYYFKGIYDFLSNFYEVDLMINGRLYKSVEHAYQAFKTKNVDEHEWIRNAPSASKAKSFGKKIKVRDNWDNLKYKTMLKLIRLKFKKPQLREKLLNTHNETIIEYNYWHDNIWGNCTCNKCKKIDGKNWLGEILMLVRDEIRNENDLFNN